MANQQPNHPNQSAEERASFIGRVQEQRQFLVALQGLLAHQRRWRDLAYRFGADFDPNQAPGDDSYADIFLIHGIGGIGKSWLARRCLALAEETPADPPVLTLYDDISLGPPVLEPVHLMDRLCAQLDQAGYEAEITPYRQIQADLPGVIDRVTHYQAESRERWDKLRQVAAGLVARETKSYGPRPTPPAEAAITARAYDLLMEQMQQKHKLTPAEAELFRNPTAAQAARLVAGLKWVTRRRPLVIALDNLEVVVSLEPFLRDDLVLPTNQAPLIWILSGRHNLADERLVEVDGQPLDYKGYRDLLGENPPVVWDMSIFGDADLAEYLEAEASRRAIALKIDESLIDAVKSTSSGVPLVVEMVADALFSMDRETFLRDFALDDKSLLPAGRLEQITTRFLRYCMQREDDLERVHALAMLRKGAAEAAIAASWDLPARQSARDVMQVLRLRYAFVLSDGLHDAIYDFVRRELRTLKQYREVRVRLGRRITDFYQVEWEQREAEVPDDALLRVRDPRWQRTARDLINALLWSDPDEAVRFLLPRFVEGLAFDRPFAEGLLLQAEEFLIDAASPISRGYANLLQQLRMGLKDISFYDEPGVAVGRMVDRLLQTPDLAPVHLSILRLWQGEWLAQEGRYREALVAYLSAEEKLPPTATSLNRQLGKAYYELSSAFLWPESTLETISSKEGLQAAERAVALDPTNGDAWYNLGAALDYLDREDEAIPAYRRAIDLEPRPAAYNGLGDVLTALGCYDEAIAAYQQAIELNPDLAWPYHNLGLLYEHRGDYRTAIPFYQQAMERHQRDKDKAVTWDNLGNVYAALGETDEAIAAYRWSGVLNPKYAPPWHGLGDVFSQLNRDDEAIAAYRQAIALDPDEPWPYNNLALVYERRDDYEQAVRLYRQALERHRDDRARAVSWHNLGDVYHAQDRSADALRAYQQAIQLDPQPAGYHNSLGGLLAVLGRYEEAIAAYRQAVKLDSEYTLAYNSLAAIYGTLGRDEESVEAYRRVIELNPDYAWAYNNLGFIHAKHGEYEAAVTLYRQALERHRLDQDKAISWFNLGRVYEVLGDDSEAINAYRQATELDPDYAWPYYNLGLIYRRRNDYEAALAAFQQAVDRLDTERETDQARVWNELGDLYRTLDRPQDALAAYQQATELDPNFALPWNSLGDLYRTTNRWGRAENSYHRANQLDPNLAWPYHNLALVQVHQGHHEAAIPLYQEALARHQHRQDQAMSWNRLGESYRVLGRLAEADQSYRQALALDPIYPWPYHNLGLLAEQQGDLPRAATFFRQALDRHQRNPDRAIAWYHLGEVYRWLAQTQEAVDAYQKAAALDPTYAEPWSSLGDVYRRLDQPDEAMTAYRRAIGLNPKEPWPYHYLGWLHEQRGQHDTASTRFQQAIERHRADPERALSWQELGQVYFTQKRYQEASKAFRQAGALDPTYALPWHYLGDTYRVLNRAEEAINAYERASRLDPAYAATWSNLGDLYMAVARPDEAISAYQRTIGLDPANSWAYHHLGDLSKQRGDYQAALSNYRQATKRHTQDHDRALAWTSLGDIYRQLHRYDQAIEAYQQAGRFDPTYAWPYHNLGLIYEEQGQFELALTNYQKAIHHHQGDQERAALWDHLGGIYQQLGQYEKAAAAYRQVNELEPHQAVPWNSLGTVYRALNRLDEAIVAYERAAELDPTYAWPYHNLGLIYQQRGEYEPALNYYQQAIERHSQDVDRAAAWEQMGHIETARQQLDEAVTAYHRATELDPADALPWYHLGNVYRSLKRTDEAISAYQRASQLEPTMAWPYHQLGLIYAERETYDAAVTYFRQAIEQHLCDVDRGLGWYDLGQVYQTLNQPTAAIEAYEQAITLNPTYARSYHQLGLIRENQGEYEAAQKLFRQAIARYAPDDSRRAAAWYHLGNTCVALGDLETAVSAYQQAGTADPNDALSRNSLGDVLAVLGRYEPAIAAYQRAAELDGAYVLPRSGLGNVYVKLGRYEEAVGAYRQAIELDPAAAWLYRNLGLVYEQQGRFEEAQQAFQQALEHYPAGEVGRDQAIAWHYLGNVYRSLGRYEEAINAYQRAIEFDPQYALPWNSLGSVYNALDRQPEAIAAYKQAIQIDPDYAWPYHNLGLISESQESYEAALKLFEEAIVRHQNERDQAASWHRLGHVYEMIGQYERAIVVYRRSIELDPTSALPWNSLGDVYNDLNDHEAAIVAYRQAIELNPDYAWPYNNLGFVYEKIGRYDQAINLYRQVIERHPHDSDGAISWNNMGNALNALNQPEEAIAAYHQAIEIDPTFTWPYHSLGTIYEQRGEADLALALYQQAVRRGRSKMVAYELLERRR